MIPYSLKFGDTLPMQQRTDSHPQGWEDKSTKVLKWNIHKYQVLKRMYQISSGDFIFVLVRRCRTWYIITLIKKLPWSLIRFVGKRSSYSCIVFTGHRIRCPRGHPISVIIVNYSIYLYCIYWCLFSFFFFWTCIYNIQ